MIQRIKKYFIIVLAFILAGSFSAVFAEETVQKYSEELAVLRAFGIYSPQGDINEAVTQEEFMNAASKIFGREFNKQYYTSIGILPFSTGRYDEEAHVSYYDALRTMVIITGYDFFAKTNGGFPSGYIKTADENGITDDVKIGNTEAITRAETAKIIMNTLETDILGADKILGDDVIYEVKSGENLLRKNFDIYEIEGIVETGAGISVSEREAKDGIAIIDGVEYETGSVNVSEFVGMRVCAYIRKGRNDDIGTILYISKDKKNSVAEFLDKDIVSYNERQYRYDDGQRERTLNLESGCEIIYNGERIAPEAEDFIPMVPENGNIVAIDNNNNGEADILFINNYKIYVADYINPSKKMVITKNTKETIEIDEDKDITITMDNSVISLNDIKTADVLNILENLNGEIKTVKVSRNAVKGKVQTTFEEYGEFFVGLDNGTEYEISKALADEFSKIKLNDSITLYLDILGRAAGFSISGNEEMRFGYLVEARNMSDDDEGPVTFVLCDLDTASQMSFLSTEKVKIDGITYKSRDVRELLQPEGGEFIARLIRYKLNAENCIKEIDTYVDNQNSLRENEDNDLIRLYSSPVKNQTTGSKQGYYYIPATNAFTQPYVNTESGSVYRWKEGFYIDSNTKILYIPQNRKDFANYTTRTISDLKEGEIIVESFRVGNENYTPSVLLIYAGDGSQQNGSSSQVNRTDLVSETESYIVTGIARTLNSEDEPTYKLTLYGLSGEVVKKTSSAELIDDLVKLQKGDIIRYGTDGAGDIAGIIVDMSMKDLKTAEGKDSASASLVGNRYIYGSIYESFGSVAALVVKNPSLEITPDDLYNFKIDAAKTITYDAKKNIASKGSEKDVYDYVNAGGKDYSKMYVRTRSGDVKAIFIINNI